MSRDRNKTTESEAPAVRRAGGLELEQSAARRGDQLPMRARALLSLQQRAGNRAVRRLVQRWRSDDAAEPLPRSNEFGLPDSLKAGVESLSGISLDEVKVHYNSSQPARLNALAYAQGTDIHVGPGQERHLPHEAWHIVQQAEARVQATGQLEDGVAVNDDSRLEREADVMGARASAVASLARQPQRMLSASAATAAAPVQRILAHNAPILATEVTGVKKVAKLVFILTGQNKDTVVVKFEQMSGGEPKPQYEDRSAGLRAIALEILANVPRASTLDANDMNAIHQIPQAVGAKADLADLKQMAYGVLNNDPAFVSFFPLKMTDKGDVENLQDKVGAAAGKPPGRKVDAPPGSKVVDPESPLWIEFGKMAAFDLLVSNADRFDDKGVNLENIDLSKASGEAASLDLVTPTTQWRTPDQWPGENIFWSPETWARTTVGEMCRRFGVPTTHKEFAYSGFIAGFADAKRKLIALAPIYAQRGASEEGWFTYSVIAARLRKNPSPKRKKH